MGRLAKNGLITIQFSNWFMFHQPKNTSLEINLDLR